METINYIAYAIDNQGKIFKYLEEITSERSGTEFYGKIISYGYVYPYGSRKSKLAWFRVDNPKSIINC